MQPDDLVKRVGVFVLVVAVVVAGSALTAVGGGTGTPTVDPLDASTLTSDDVVGTVPAEEGSVSMSADAEGKVVVVDVSHGASLDRVKVTPLVQTLTENGATVKFYNERAGDRSLNETLRKADAYVAFGAAQPYTDDQVRGLKAFADGGGRILVFREPPTFSPYSFLFGPAPEESTNPRPLTPLTSEFGVSYGNGYLYNMHEYDNNYRNVYATPDGSSDLTDGVSEVVVHESIPVTGPNTVLTTGSKTELSQTRTQGSYSVVVRSGNFVAVGDASLVSQDFYQRADNEVLVGNLLDYLVSGDKEPGVPKPPEENGPSGEEPRPPRTPAPGPS